MESFVESNFNYCLLVCDTPAKKAITKIKNIQKQSLHYLHDDFESGYSEPLQKASKTTMKTQRLTSL